MKSASEQLIESIRKDHLTYLTEQRLDRIASACASVENSGIPGIFIEAGCALGGSSILITSLKNQARPMIIYDMFGLIPPPTWQDPAEVHERYKIIAEGKSPGIGGDLYYGYLDNLMEVVRANFIKFGLDCEKNSVSFVRGLIQETMNINSPVAFAHIDVDWYEPVLTSLMRIFPNLSVGGSIIIDDYHDWGGCRKATDEYLTTVAGQFTADDHAGSLMITRTRNSQEDGSYKRMMLQPDQYHEIRLEEFMKKYAGREVVYCANPGNAGDAIIACATFRLFKKLNIKPSIVRHTEIVSGQTVFYAGGGNLVEGKYQHAFHFIENNYRQNKEIIILPHSVCGYDELLLSASNLVIICREKNSYENLANIGIPAERLFLAHDMAFSLPTSEFSAFLQQGSGTAHIMRTDSESMKSNDLPYDNLDISMSWNGELWHRPEFAENVTFSLACYLSAFEIIETDRLHVAILSAMMNKKVILYSNNYYKNKAVYAYSIREKFPNVSFIDLPHSPEPPAAAQDLLKRQEWINQNEKIAILQATEETFNKMLQSRSWRMTAPLRALAEFFRAGR
jgi:asparagine synthase (glutamine-hydrolysing)